MLKPFVLTDEFHIAMGKFTIAWQTVEIPLDAITGILFWRAGSDKYAKELPRSLDPKIKFCKKCFGNLPLLAELKEGALLVLNRTKELSIDRHRMTHGLIDNITPLEEGVLLINRLRYEDDKQFVETTQTSMTEIIETFEKINALSSAYTLLLDHVCKKFGIDFKVRD